MATYSRKRSPRALRTTHPLLDEVNIRLLAQLQTNPRMPMTELARRVKMSAPSVTERVQRLEEAGVIAGYRLEVSPQALGLPDPRSIGEGGRDCPADPRGRGVPSHHGGGLLSAEGACRRGRSAREGPRHIPVVWHDHDVHRPVVARASPPASASNGCTHWRGFAAAVKVGGARRRFLAAATNGDWRHGGPAAWNTYGRPPLTLGAVQD